MYCPFKMANPELTDHYSTYEESHTGNNWECARNNCELWNERFGRCSFAVDAYLKGQADMRAERGVKD